MLSLFLIKLQDFLLKHLQTTASKRISETLSDSADKKIYKTKSIGDAVVSLLNHIKIC